MIREARPMKSIRIAVVALALALTGAASVALPSVARAQAASPTTTGVMVVLTVKAGVTREQVTTVMPAEIRQTVKNRAFAILMAAGICAYTIKSIRYARSNYL